MVSTSSKIGLASLCPRAVYLLNKYGSRETREMVRGEERHEIFSKDVERSIYVKSHRNVYVAATIIIFLIMLALVWMMMKGLI